MATETKAGNDDETIPKIAERLKFFLSDANIRQDFFIRKRMISQEGPYPHQITVESLLKFNTIKQYSTDPDVIVQAAKTIPDQLVVSKDGKAIGRVERFTLSKMKDNIPKSLFVSNLPIQEQQDDKPPTYAVNPQEIRELFEQYGNVAIVKLRFKRPDSDEDDDLDNNNNDGNNRRQSYGNKRVPLGAALVEFEKEEDLQKAAGETLTSKDGIPYEDPKRKLTLGDKELSVILLKDYLDSCRKRRKSGSPKKHGTKEEDEKEIEVEEFKFDWKPGCVIQIKGLSEQCDREAILDALAKGLDTTVDKVKEQKIYADYSRGQKDGAIRFAEPSDSIAEMCKKLAAGDVEIAGAKVESARVLEGEEESKYWTDFIEFKNKQIRMKAEQKASRKSKKPRRY